MRIIYSHSHFRLQIPSTKHPFDVVANALVLFCLTLQIQIWLAMAYEANNRHRDCIALYQQLEKHHPSVSIRKQAAELRYILQAPKLKISKDEMVTIPLIGSSYDRLVLIRSIY